MCDFESLKQAVDAINAGDAEALQVVITEHPDLLDEVFMGRFTLLNFSAKVDSIPCMDVLIKAGMTINTTDAEYDPPIALASQKGHLESVKWLIEQGAEINGIEHYRPLVFAIHSGSEALLQWLLDNGAERDFTFGNFNQTPVDLAKKLGPSHAHVVTLLETYGR